MKKRGLVLIVFLLIIGFVSAEEATMDLTIQEQVKCLFTNSNTEQKCYTEDGMFGCAGIQTCVSDISGEKGKKLSWKSSCPGEATTIIDGENKYAEFKCSNDIKQEDVKQEVKGQLKEPMTCVFADSDKEEKCYSDDGLFSCSGIGKCAADVYGEKDKKLTWKSSCGGYAYTVIDGNSDYAEFKCITAEVTQEEITGKGFRYAFWQCYDGGGQKQGSPDSCQSAEILQKLAKEFCEKRCYKDNSKCGVNSYSVSEECYLDSMLPPTAAPAAVQATQKAQEVLQKVEEKKELKEEKKGEILICKDSCPLDEKCYPFGYRSKGTYCSDKGSFVEQLKEDSVCENNFECSSNVCVNNQCLSSGLIEKILSWFKKVFS